MATEPNALLLSDESVPRVPLGGVAWPIPRLAQKQNKRVTPLIVKHRKALRKMNLGQDALDALTEEAIEELGTVVYVALTRGHPDMTRAEFDDMPIGVLEILAAFPVVAAQTGLFVWERTETNGVSADPLVPAAASSPTGTA